MTNCVINNETIENCNPLPFLTITLPNKEVTVMTNSIISETPKVCQVEGCTNKYYGKGYCKKHWEQVWKFGHIKRTKFDPNEFIVGGDICTIKLYDAFGAEIAEAIIDAEDADMCMKYKWQLTHIGRDKSPYVSTQSSKTLYLQNAIMKHKEGYMVDHINWDTLDNRKCNLRHVTHSQNLMNRGPQKDNKSGYKGVSKRRNKWHARITENGNIHVLGDYNTPELAALAYNEASIKYHGEFGYINEVSP